MLLQDRDVICQQLRTQYEALEEAVDAFNAAMEAQWEGVANALEAYNSTVEQANEWLSMVSSEIEAYMSDRSEKWQDSERGQAYEQWKNEFESNDLEAVELDMPAALELYTGLGGWASRSVSGRGESRGLLPGRAGLLVR
jgi:hypothetical protein